MPVSAQLAHDPAVTGPIGSLALSCVRAASPMLVVRAIRWYRDLARLGVRLPFFLVHDLGLLYAVPREQLDMALRPSTQAVIERVSGLRERALAYRALVAEIAESEVCRRARAMRLGDDLVVVVLARLLGVLARRMTQAPPYPPTLPLDPDLARDLDAQLVSLFFALPRTFELRALDALLEGRLHVLTVADALDLDTLRLLGMLGPENSTAGALAHVDLLAAMSNPAANDIVQFSLELLPSVLETRRSKATGTHATDGYAGIGNKGSVDSMVLTELAWDDEEFARRLVESEVHYYTREHTADEARRLHYILVDASASMRGDRQVFARGLAIALTKKLQLQGDEVWLRFFDSRLYEVHRARGGHLPVAHLLSFKGERGRNPARVFTQLVSELGLLRARDRRDPVVHVITHAALHVPRHLVEAVRAEAHLFGVFILPSGGKLDLEYLDLLESHAVIDNATLASTHARRAAATKIVSEVTERGERVTLPPRARSPFEPEDAVPPSLRPSRVSIPPSVR